MRIPLRTPALAAPERSLAMLGMATRAGALVPGTERVRLAARDGSLRFAIVAADASHNSRDKLVPLLDARGMTYVTRFTRAELGAAVGRAPLSAVGVLDRALADRLQVLLRDGAV
jgi:ribosomal protein L7Ae-like RNA K-turn-binding protein